MKNLVFLLLLFSAALGQAQPASQTVRGTVLDAASKSPLPGATGHQQQFDLFPNLMHRLYL